MKMRLTNRLLAVVIALGLLVLSVLVLAEIVWAALGGGGELVLPYQAVAEYLAGLHWDSAAARGILIGVALLGVLLVVVELRRSRPGLLTLAGSAGPVTKGVERRTLQQAAAAAATEVDGISSARARVSRRRVSVATRSGLRDVTGLQDQLTAHLGSWLEGLGLVDPPALSVRVAENKSRRARST